MTPFWTLLVEIKKKFDCRYCYGIKKAVDKRYEMENILPTSLWVVNKHLKINGFKNVRMFFFCN